MIGGDPPKTPQDKYRKPQPNARSKRRTSPDHTTAINATCYKETPAFVTANRPKSKSKKRPRGRRRLLSGPCRAAVPMLHGGGPFGFTSTMVSTFLRENTE